MPAKPVDGLSDVRRPFGERVYYLDVPLKYAALRDVYPHIQVWPFSRFYAEADALFKGKAV